jgi:hypothetical protein
MFGYVTAPDVNKTLFAIYQQVNKLEQGLQP